MSDNVPSYHGELGSIQNSEEGRPKGEKTTEAHILAASGRPRMKRKSIFEFQTLTVFE